MNIFVMSSGMDRAFAALGHNVLALPFNHGAPAFDLAAELRRRDFVPDLIFQEESLTERVLLQGLDEFDCPKIFWSLDAHLNLFWHVYYARLFDGVLTPHLSFWEQTLDPKPPLERLARYGRERPWRPHAERRHGVGFVGRITEQRPLRKHLTDFLHRQYDALLVSEVPFLEMLRVYEDVRLAPNESIMAEVNFRLMETASCGCLPFCQDVGEDQDALFTPGKEIVTFGDVVELKALLDYFLARPDLAELKARAAWERVKAEHLPEHCARRALDFAGRLPRSGARGWDASTAFWLSVWQLRRAKRIRFPLARIEDALAAQPATAEILAARAALMVWLGQQDVFMELAALLLGTGRFQEDTELNLACSMAALKFGDQALALRFWRRNEQAPREGKASEPRPTPQGPVGLCLAWARVLLRERALRNPGAFFDPELHLPASALECLHLAQSFERRNLEAVRLADAIYARMRGGEYYRLGALSELTLLERKDWRAGLALGVANLRSFRLREGLTELYLALAEARNLGKERSFLRALSSLDHKGYIRSALTALDNQNATVEKPTEEL
jgi:hypothetical protein